MRSNSADGATHNVIFVGRKSVKKRELVLSVHPPGWSRRVRVTLSLGVRVSGTVRVRVDVRVRVRVSNLLGSD